MTEKRWLIIGADRRMHACMAALQKEYPACTLWAEDAGADGLLSCVAETKPTHVVLPVTGLQEDLPEGVFQAGTEVYTGRLTAVERASLERDGCRVRSYLNDERFVWNNARLTAEAFIKEFWMQTGEPAAGLEIGIAGYGRVGRMTAAALSGLGTEIVVYARSEAQLGEAEALGHTARVLDPGNMPMTGYLINTIPDAWFMRDPDSTLHVFELASMPGCLKPGSSPAYYTVHLGLPGKHFPRRAGEFLAQTVSRMCGGKE